MSSRCMWLMDCKTAKRDQKCPACAKAEGKAAPVSIAAMCKGLTHAPRPAAPDLLAALHLAAEALDAYSDVNDGQDGPSALQEIDAVIAKAEGKPR